MEAVQETSTPAEVVAALYGTTDLTLDESMKVVKIRRVKIKYMASILAIAKSLLDTLGLTGGKVTIDLKDPVVMLRLMAELPQQCTDLMAMLSSLTKEEIEDLDIADGLQLLVRVIEVNRSFFMEKVLPKLAGLKGIAGLSQPPSA